MEDPADRVIYGSPFVATSGARRPLESRGSLYTRNGGALAIGSTHSSSNVGEGSTDVRLCTQGLVTALVLEVKHWCKYYNEVRLHRKAATNLRFAHSLFCFSPVCCGSMKLPIGSARSTRDAPKMACLNVHRRGNRDDC